LRAKRGNPGATKTSACFIHAGRPKAGAKLAMTGEGAGNLTPSLRAKQSSGQKNGAPVSFTRVGRCQTRMMHSPVKAAGSPRRRRDLLVFRDPAVDDMNAA